MTPGKPPQLQFGPLGTLSFQRFSIPGNFVVRAQSVPSPSPVRAQSVPTARASSRILSDPLGSYPRGSERNRECAQVRAAAGLQNLIPRSRQNASYKSSSLERPPSISLKSGLPSLPALDKSPRLGGTSQNQCSGFRQHFCSEMQERRERWILFGGPR